MIHNSMCLFVLPADELVGMSYFHKCLLFCSWGPQGVGLCQTDLPLSRVMGSFSGGSLSMADTPTQYIYDSDWYASYQNSLLFLILFTGISGVYHHRQTKTPSHTDTCRLMQLMLNNLMCLFS